MFESFWQFIWRFSTLYVPSWTFAFWHFLPGIPGIVEITHTFSNWVLYTRWNTFSNWVLYTRWFQSSSWQKQSPTTTKFCDILESFDLEQHVNFPTHIHGHWLDLLITRTSCPAVGSVLACDGLSDHFLVLSELEFPRPKCVKKKISFRRINKIDLDNLKNDILNSDLKIKPEKDLPKLCKQYDTILQTILNKHAPLLTKTVSERPPTPWMTQEILKAKVRRRHLGRVWRRTRCRHDRSRYRVQCNLCNRIMEKAEANFYANIILENSEDPKKLWKSINNILHRFPAPSLPENLSRRPNWTDH